MIKKSLIFSFLLLPVLAAFSQKRDLTFRQIFGDERPQLSRPLPTIITWTDDDHYVELRTDDTHGAGRSRPMKVEAKTGKSVPYDPTETNTPIQRAYIKDNDIFYSASGEAEKRLTNNADPEINPTLSPDGKWVAFTRLNNLYAVEVSSGKETALTSEHIK